MQSITARLMHMQQYSQHQTPVTSPLGCFGSACFSDGGGVKDGCGWNSVLGDWCYYTFGNTSNIKVIYRSKHNSLLATIAQPEQPYRSALCMPWQAGDSRGNSAIFFELWKWWCCGSSTRTWKSQFLVDLLLSQEYQKKNKNKFHINKKITKISSKQN
jgi:hypothetical protein